MTVLIGFTGCMGSGKSTAAAILVERGDFEVLSFAHPLKEMAAALLMAGFGFGRRDVDFHLKNKHMFIPELGVTMRYLLQTLGTDWGRKLINQRLWVRSADQRIENRWEYCHMAIDDVRFEEEAELIRAAGGLVIHMARPDCSPKSAHASEAGIVIRPGDVVIVNDTSLADLRETVMRVVEWHASPSDRLLELCLTPCSTYQG